MSFALTPDQIKAQTKTVTRRLGWQFLKPGELLCAVRKCQGLKKGEKVERLAVLRVVTVRRERLDKMNTDVQYGIDEVEREGLVDHPLVKGSPSAFVDFFCSTHRPCNPGWLITRIQFEYLPS